MTINELLAALRVAKEKLGGNADVVICTRDRTAISVTDKRNASRGVFNYGAATSTELDVLNVSTEDGCVQLFPFAGLDVQLSSLLDRA